MNPNTIYCGDALEVMSSWEDNLVQCCVTSPPYWGLRDYGVDGQLGLESTPEEYIENDLGELFLVDSLMFERGDYGITRYIPFEDEYPYTD